MVSNYSIDYNPSKAACIDGDLLRARSEPSLLANQQ